MDSSESINLSRRGWTPNRSRSAPAGAICERWINSSGKDRDLQFKPEASFALEPGGGFGEPGGGFPPHRFSGKYPPFGGYGLGGSNGLLGASHD